MFNLKQLYFLERVIMSNIARTKVPYKLAFALTYHCNLRCKSCFIWSREAKNELTYEEIEKFFEKSNKFSWIHLTGGEMFLRDDLNDIIDLIFDYCRYLCLLNIVTNGQLTEKIVSTIKRMIKKWKITPIITVSIDGPPDINNMIRGSSAAWDNAVATFVELKKLKLQHVYIGYTISQYNVGKIYDMFDSVKLKFPRLTYNDIHINFAHNSEHYLNNSSLYFPLEKLFDENLGKVLENQKGVKAILEKQYHNKLRQYVKNKRMPLRCQAMRTYCFLDPYGDVYPCSIYNHKIVNIKEIGYDLRKLWEHDLRTEKVRNEIFKGRCPHCWTPCEAYPAILGSLRQIAGDAISSVILNK